jgi:hypothetical protein
MPAKRHGHERERGKVRTGLHGRLLLSCVFGCRNQRASSPSAAGSEDWSSCAGARGRSPGPAGWCARHALALGRRIRDPCACVRRVESFLRPCVVRLRADTPRLGLNLVFVAAELVWPVAVHLAQSSRVVARFQAGITLRRATHCLGLDRCRAGAERGYCSERRHEGRQRSMHRGFLLRLGLSNWRGPGCCSSADAPPRARSLRQGA